MKSAPRKARQLKRRRPQGLTAALIGKPKARRWVCRQLRSTRPLATISAELQARFGIHASVRALSYYLHRHAVAVIGKAALPAASCEGRWLLTIHAPGAAYVEAIIAPAASDVSRAAACKVSKRK